MKIRTGFVSNSSSSSFICMVSGHVEAGYDLPMADTEFVRCANDHEFMQQYFVGEFPDYDDDDYDEDWIYNANPKNCPICTLTHIVPEDLLNYLLQTEDIDKEMIIDKIRQSFSDHKTFKESLQ